MCNFTEESSQLYIEPKFDWTQQHSTDNLGVDLKDVPTGPLANKSYTTSLSKLVVCFVIDTVHENTVEVSLAMIARELGFFEIGPRAHFKTKSTNTTSTRVPMLRRFKGCNHASYEQERNETVWSHNNPNFPTIQPKYRSWTWVSGRSAVLF